MGLDKLIIDKVILVMVREIVSCLFGLILVIGLIGFGKFIFLYLILVEWNDLSINISMVEDLIEYVLLGII